MQVLVETCLDVGGVATQLCVKYHVVMLGLMDGKLS